MLGLIRALEDWRHFLEGLPEPFEVHTDHKNMEWWSVMQNLNRRQAMWTIYLSHFTFNIQYIQGKTNRADVLSRAAISSKYEDSQNNHRVVTIKPKQLIVAVQLSFCPESDDLTSRIRNASAREAEVIKGLKSINKHAPRALTDGTMLWEEEDSLVFCKGKLYIPNNHALRKDIVKSCHDAPLAGHAGKNGILELVQRNYWWPHMATYVLNYVEGCEKCQRYRKNHHPTVPVQPQKIPEGSWQTIGVDLITGLPMSHGKNAIMTVIDHFTKQVHLYPVTDSITADGVADIYFHKVFPLHGFPKKIISDRGPQFTTRPMRQILKKIGIDSSLTTAYHPQANRQTERKNQEVKQYLHLYTSRVQDD